ncbi:MAG: hypothetical protein GX824_09690 [Clostridiales bacterium]|jgi:hypothetical protein|nr:hypothetical protein [Clostridiales bacterium]
MTNKNGFNTELSIDEILIQAGLAEDYDTFTDSSSGPVRSWSLEDIDALLAQEKPKKKSRDGESSERKEEPVIPVPAFTKTYVDSLFKTKDETSFEEKPVEEDIKEDYRKFLSEIKNPLQDKSKNVTAEIKEDSHTGTDEGIFYTEPQVQEEKPEEPINAPAEKEEITEPVVEEKATKESESQIPGLIYDEDLVDTSVFVHEDAITGSQMETNKYRERFMNMLKVEKTSELDVMSSNEPIEKPGVILSKSNFSGTEDLSAMPIVIPAEDALKTAQREEEKTKISDGSARILQKEASDVVDGQIMLSGFDSDEEPEQIDEHLAERELMEKRRQAAKSFKIFDIPESYDETIPSKEGDPLSQGEGEGEAKPLEQAEGSVEYVYPSDKSTVGRELRYRRKSGLAKTVLLICIEAALIITMFVPKILSLLSVENAENAGSGLVPSIISFVLIVIAGACCWADIFNGLKRLFKMRANADSAAALAMLCAVIQNISFMATGAGPGVFSASAVMLLLLNTAGHSIENARVMENFRLCAVTNASKLHSVSEFEDEKENFEIGRSLLLGTPEVRLSRKIGFPTNFISHSYEGNFTDDLCRFLVPGSALFGILTAVISYIKVHSISGSLSVLSAALCLAAPAGLLFVSNVLFRSENKKLNENGAMIAGFAGAKDIARINAVVIDGADLFDQSHCDLHGMKDYKNVRIDDVLLYTASMVINSGGPLTEIFDKVISNSRDLLPTVKSLGYEDKMGLSGIIHKQKVLFGNRSLLLNHGVDVPNERNEAKYCHDGRRILYLAIANKIAAMFVVSYTFDLSLTQYLKYLESSGINILVRNSDPNITENILNAGFGLQRGTIRLLSPNSGRIFKKSREKAYDYDEATVLNDGRVKSFLHSVGASAWLGLTEKIVGIIQAAGVILGITALLIFVLLGAFERVSELWIIAYSLVMLAVTFAGGRMKGIR